MKLRYILLPLFLVAFTSCARSINQENKISEPAALASLPDNPCDILSADEVSAATGLEVMSATRVPSLSKVVEAQRENREPGPGTICNYQTRGDFGSIMIALPPVLERNSAKYWEVRNKYFEEFPTERPVPGLGMDAWISGGSTLRVLVKDDHYFTVSTQMNKPGSRELVIKIARAALAQR